MAETEQVTWSFGYGSNMDVKALEIKKHVKILDYTPAIFRGWKMTFSLQGPHYVEPAYANIVPGDDKDEVHGVAFCMSLTSLAELDRVESGYDKKPAIFEAYDGRQLKGFAYVNKPTAKVSWDLVPSARYLGVLVEGARKAGLKEEYIQRLESSRVYQPSQETLTIRASLPPPEQLPKMSVEDLAKHDGSDEAQYPTRVCVLGYIVQPESKIYFRSHKGRDTTTRFLMQYNGISLDDNDDRGRPPYPILTKLAPDELEYVSRWLDHYLSKCEGKSLAFLKEFDEQQKSGETTWNLPKP